MGLSFEERDFPFLSVDFDSKMRWTHCIQFAAWGLCFACFDCSFAHLRQKEDPWNTIMSGAAAGAVMAARDAIQYCCLIS